MKRVMSVVLAVCLLCGVGAVGANALILPEIAESGYFEAPSDFLEASVLQAGYEDLTPEERDEISDITLKATIQLIAIEFVILWPIAPTDWSMTLKDVSKADDYRARLVEAFEAAKNSAASKAFEDFCKDEDAIVAAYRAGTLESQLINLGEAYLIVINASIEPVFREYFKPECYEFMTAWIEEISSEYTLMMALDEDERAAVNAQYEAAGVTGLAEAIIDLAKEGKWAEAKALVDKANSVTKRILVELGLREPTDGPEKPAEPDKIYDFFASFLPESVASVMAWIIRYLCFGWLWGRWL